MGIGGRLGSGAGSEKCESQHSRALFRTRMSSEEEGATMKTVWRLLIDEPEVTLPWMTSNERIAIGWGEIGDVLHLGSLDAIAEAIRERNENHPDHAGKPAANVQHGCNSLYDFWFQMEPGDLVIISDRVHRRCVWEVVGGYEYVEQSAAPLILGTHESGTIADRGWGS